MRYYNQTAILLFSRSPREEALHKQLAGAHSYRVSKALFRHSLREAKKTDLPLFSIMGPQQEGSTFGEKLANATESVFKKGFEKVIIIGSDSPELCSELLKKAQKSLEKQEVVLGPAKDGGVYLIGLSAQAYHRTQFIDLAWETTSLQASIRYYLEQQSAKAQYLPTLTDLDCAQDFTDWYPTLSHRRLSADLKVALQVAKQEYSIQRHHFISSIQFGLDQVSRRGPPIVLSYSA